MEAIQMISQLRLKATKNACGIAGCSNNSGNCLWNPVAISSAKCIAWKTTAMVNARLAAALLTLPRILSSRNAATATAPSTRMLGSMLAIIDGVSSTGSRLPEQTLPAVESCTDQRQQHADENCADHGNTGVEVIQRLIAYQADQ